MHSKLAYVREPGFILTNEALVGLNGINNCNVGVSALRHGEGRSIIYNVRAVWCLTRRLSRTELFAAMCISSLSLRVFKIGCVRRRHNPNDTLVVASTLKRQPEFPCLL